MESVYQTSKIEKVLKFSSAGLFMLAALCFMVYTTQQSYTYADNNDEYLGYDISSVDTSVTVGTACTFTGTITAPHTATIANGINSTDIGTTVLNTKCNDSGGYALYAIGYTGDEYGATDLSYTSLDGTTTNSGYDISTGTATSGNTSNWSMKLSPVAGTTTATIDNGYDSYNIVPGDYTKVATLSTVTDPGSSTAGSSVSTTYQSYISPTQPAGTYTGKVKYTLVHPSTAPKPEKPVFMQDTATIKSKLVNYGDTMQAIDKRDGKKYWITKLKDGNIWMTQNLDFDIVNGGANINSTNTDVPANWADAGNLANTYTASTTSWKTYIHYTPESYDPGNLYWNGELNSYGTLDNMTNPTGDPHYHIGNYYNWTAAVAMSNSSSYTSYSTDVNQSICPAGWRLPNNSDNKSYQNLIDRQGLTSGTDGNIQKNPTYFVYGGYWLGYSKNVGFNGGYWSALNRPEGNAENLTFNRNGFIQSLSESGRYTGWSLRCVVR